MTRPSLGSRIRLAACAALSCLMFAGCMAMPSTNPASQNPSGNSTGASSQSSTNSNTSTNASSSTNSNSSSSLTASPQPSTGLSMQTERGSKKLDIERMSPGASRPASVQDDTWTVFVYLCGSDLETNTAAASKDLNEMLQGGGNDRVKFVVETGGARTWQNNIVSNRQLGRYLIQAGNIQDLGAVSAANMGDPNTLVDFLSWGINAYPADHMALVLWDHGGGSISGVCFDEQTASRDSLYLRELDQALASVFPKMWDKFEFIGFDACLMSTLETANVLASYSKYMVASQESEPATGWEYSSLVKYLAQNPGSDGNQFGRELCNSYLNSLDRNSKGFATLSVVDLSQIDQLIQDFYAFSQEIFESGNDQATLAAMSRGIQNAENYGCNNRREGYTNMVDLGGLVDACASIAPSAAKVKESLNNAVTYQIRGTYHASACGLSTYYPLKINGSQELSIFNTVVVNPSYLDYINRLATGATYNGGSQYQNYSGGNFYQDSLWNWLMGNATEVQEAVEDNWNYVDDHQDGSTQISFADEPQVDDEGTLWFKFDEEGLNKAAVVSGIVYEKSDDGEDFIVLGETYDVYGDWETGQFADGFDGQWLSLPDGQNLNISVDSSHDDYIVYTSPIKLNGKECYLRLNQNIKSGEVVVEGAWNAVDSSGAVDRGITAIKKGDVIVPLYRAFSNDESQASSNYEGVEYSVEADELQLGYKMLPEGSYLYGFIIQDSFGDSFYTDCATFEIDADGTIYFV